MAEPAGVTWVPHSDRAGTGLTEWEPVDADSLVSGTPVQRGWFCAEDSDTGYMAGVWDCTEHVLKPGPYEVDEFMFLLEGTVVMVMPDGTEITINAGEAFMIPMGLECQWKMPTYVRKVFMIVSDPVPGEAANPALGRVTVPDLASPAAGGPVETSETWFRNAAGRMTVEVRTHAGGHEVAAAATAHELLHVREGGLTLTGEGGELRLGPGETAYVTAGTRLARAYEPATRLIASTYAPA